MESRQSAQAIDEMRPRIRRERFAAAHRVAGIVIEQVEPGRGLHSVSQVERNDAHLTHHHNPSSPHMASTRALTAGSMTMGRPHSRFVSPGHLLVASRPILLPNPATGLAKSR